jgi:flavin-dependent dehydrogenase
LNETPTYDVAIIGGGLAGLSLSIQLARKGHRIILFEKQQYPFHRVCGEYISMESWDFLKRLGLELEQMGVSTINELELSGVNGKIFQNKLPLGGFGISRYVLDHSLATIARSESVELLENSRVDEVVFQNETFSLVAGQKRYYAKVVCACFGKRSNLDIKWKRSFSQAATSKLNNYVGIKYHVQLPFPSDRIALHLFDNGYCGIVKVENEKYNLCYLTTAENLARSGGNIESMENAILQKNPHLKKAWDELKKLETPVTVSQLSFDKKEQVKDHVLFCGDAAGMITPLCGNGMSMALHGSKLLANEVHHFLIGKQSRTAMEHSYTRAWEKNFGARLQTGRLIQRLFGSAILTNSLIGIGRTFPSFINWLIRKTHGKGF